jgi:hypothetical protein
LIAAGVFIDGSIFLLILAAAGVVRLLALHGLVSKRAPAWGNLIMGAWLLLAAAGVYSILKAITGW